MFCCAGLATSAAGGITSAVGTMSSRLGFSLLFVMTIVLALFLRAVHPDFLVDLGEHNCEGSGCKGKLMVYRVMFSVWAFFLLHALIMIGTPVNEPENGRRVYQRGFWKTKMFTLIIAIVLGCFLPAEILNDWTFIAMVFAGVFLVVQFLLLIDGAYSWNDAWVIKDERKWLIYLLICSGIFFTLSLIAIYFEFALFTSATYVSITIAGKHGALLPAAIICFYCCYLTFSALSSQPNTDSMNCNSIRDNDTSSTWQMLLGLAIAILAVTHSTNKAAGRGDALIMSQSGDDLYMPSTSIISEDYNCSYFHSIFSLGAAYIAMLLTSWGDTGDYGDYSIDRGTTSMWIKMVSTWVVAALYTWSLIAPMVLKNREFS